MGLLSGLIRELVMSAGEPLHPLPHGLDEDFSVRRVLDPGDGHHVHIVLQGPVDGQGVTMLPGHFTETGVEARVGWGNGRGLHLQPQGGANRSDTLLEAPVPGVLDSQGDGVGHPLLSESRG